MTGFNFKKLSESDWPLLLQWFTQPHVAKWWPVPKKNESLDKFLKRIRSKDTFGYIVYLGELPIGYVQCYPIDYKTDKTGSWLPPLPMYTVGTDQFIGEPNYIGRGYGTAFIKEFIKYLSEKDSKIKNIIVDPDPKNKAAIRCYEKVGFIGMGEYKAPWGMAMLMQYDMAGKK